MSRGHHQGGVSRPGLNAGSHHSFDTRPTTARRTQRINAGADSPPIAQTLVRGLALMEAVTREPVGLDSLAAALELSRSTTYRLATALLERGYLRMVQGTGYALGPKLMQLGSVASRSTDLQSLARPHLQRLAESSSDAANLGVLDAGCVRLVDTVPGSRRIHVTRTVGEHRPITSSALGKALLLDNDAVIWGQYFQAETGKQPESIEGRAWLARMSDYAAWGHAFDLEEDEALVRCVAVPVRDAAGRIIASLSLSAVNHYMSEERMSELAKEIKQVANALSLMLGWESIEEAREDGSRVHVAPSAGQA